jgi:CheY-like chemotaxis protein
LRGRELRAAAHILVVDDVVLARMVAASQLRDRQRPPTPHRHGRRFTLGSSYAPDFVVLLVVTVAHAQAHLDRSDEFFRRCDRAEGSWADLCTGYVVGLGDMLRTAKRQYRADVIICIPAGLTVGQASDGFMQYLKDHAGDPPMYTATAYALSLSRAYPCATTPGPQAKQP